MEKAHDISLDEPCVAHQAILFMLDVLMRSQAPSLPLDELYDSFGDKSFTPQMLRAVGGNEQGLKAFLVRYPSLFTVGPGDLVSANSGGSQLPARLSTTPDRYLRNKTKPNIKPSTPTPTDQQPLDPDLANSSSSSSSSSSGGISQQIDSSSSTVPAVYEQSKTMKEIEQEAIAFFRKQMTKREEDWLQIVSVAGHASQSSADIRKFVGPQNEFKSFLVKYPHIFVVRDEYCGLKGRADISAQPFPPPSPPPKRRLLPTSLIGNGLMSQQTQPSGLLSNMSTPGVLTRTHSFKSSASSTNHRYSACILPNNSNQNQNSLTSSMIHQQQPQSLMSPTTSNGMNGVNGSLGLTNASNSSLGSSATNGVGGGASNKPRLTPIEVRAVHYVMRILHKNGRMLLQTIPGLISRAPDQVSNVVGFTREDLIQFFKRHSAIFQLHPDGCVSVKQDAVKALILKDISTSGANGGVMNMGPGIHMNGGVNGGVNGVPNNLMLNGNSAQQQQDVQPGIITNSGVVLRIFPKYGILNMENNEQVFFDIQSCQFETFNDLTTILHMGDRLYFNAVIGPRDGSTKWRSIKTWIKMKPQQQTAAFDNLSSHSDADKSDDSSTSSSHGMHMVNGGGPNNGGTYSGRHHHNNLLYHNSFHTNNYNGYNPAASPFQSTNLNQFYLPQSPTSTTNTSISSPLNTSGVNNEDTINMSASNSNLSIASSSNPNGAPGEFNQYQLDTNSIGSNGTEFIPSAGATPSDPTNATGGDESATLSSSSMSSSQLIHSSSTNNLANAESKLVNNTTNNTNNNNNNNNSNNNTNPSQHMSTSKSIHSFSPSASEDSKLKQTQAENNSTNNNNNLATTRFMKQSPDNISQKEVLTITLPPPSTTTSITKQLVSIGCQTISTGDITVTDVYIE